MTIVRTTTIAVTLIAAAFSLVAESSAQRPANLFAETSTTMLAPPNTDPIQDIYRAALAMRHVNEMVYRNPYDQAIADGQPKQFLHFETKQALEALDGVDGAHEFFGTNYVPRNLRSVACKSCGALDVVVFSDQHTVFLSIYGTRGEMNGHFNVGLPVPRHEFDMTKVHGGWSALATANYEWIKGALDANAAKHKRVIVTGYSLGGPVAGYLTHLLMKDGYLARDKQHRLVTFGAPRYATPTFKYCFLSRVANHAPLLKVYSVEFKEDQVPYIWDACIPLIHINYLGSLLQASGSYCGVTSDFHGTKNYRKLVEKYTGNN